ncbi:hypothetical protein PG988_001311 [Apiospora saccharicola]
MANRILELPIELMLEIFEYISDDAEDLKSFARVTSCFYALAIDRIWDRADQDHRYRIFMWACASGSPRAVRRLLESGFTANLNFQLRDKTHLKDLTPDFYLKLPPNLTFSQTGWIDSYACIPYMDDYHNPAAPSSSRNDAHFWKPLHVAAHYGHANIVDILLRHGAWVDATSMNYCKCTRPVFSNNNTPTTLRRFTPLHVALCNRHEDVAQVLIAQGGATMYIDHHVYRACRTCGPNRGRITALHLCASYGLLSTTKFLLEGGYIETGIDELDEFGFSSIMYAYHFGHNEVFDYLLAQGASPRLGNTSVPDIFEFGVSSILHQACHDTRWETVAKLINHGCDAHELDGTGDPLMILCIKSYFHQLMRDPTSEIILESKRMISMIESCGLQVRVPQEKLVAVVRYALKGAVAPLVSSLLDYGLDISTKLPSHERDDWLCSWDYRLKGWDGTESSDGEAPYTILPESYYNDTGRVRRQQTLLEYVCYHSVLSPNTQQVIELLLNRGCIQPGDIQSYVRVIKHLCCNRFNYDKYDRSRDDPESNQQRCIQTLCSRLSATIQDSSPKPQLPADLLYVCLKERLHPVAEDIVNAFDFANSVYSEEELMHFLFALLYKARWDCDVRQIRLLDLVFQADMNNRCYLLQHERTFERLCKTFLYDREGEKAILDYLDRGGRYAFTFADAESSSALFAACSTGSLQLAKRLLDMGANPNNLTPSDWQEIPSWNTDFWPLNDHNVDVLRLLLERGGDPFRTGRDGKNGIHFPFGGYLEGTDEEFEFYQYLCKMAINDVTGDGNLFTVVELACVRGKYPGIQELRLRGGSRVDALLRGHAVPFLQKLLANLYSFDSEEPVENGGDGIFCGYYVNIEVIDEAIDTIRLLLALGPSGILESDWCLEEPRVEGLTALRLLERLLTHPDNPHIEHAKYERCDKFATRYRSRIAWCLNERTKIYQSVNGEAANVTVLDGEIAFPEEWYEHWARPETEWGESKRGFLQEIPMPDAWNCSCEMHENMRVRDLWHY